MTTFKNIQNIIFSKCHNTNELVNIINIRTDSILVVNLILDARYVF